MYSDKIYFLTKIDEQELDKLTAGSEINLDAAIQTADSMIDSYLTNVVAALPLANPPEVIKQISYDIAIFYLHDRIQYNDIPERVKAKYDAAVFFLKDIARGQANIPGLAVPDVTEGINFASNTNIFNRGIF
jgi:phage gp36-like protein